MASFFHSSIVHSRLSKIAWFILGVNKLKKKKSRKHLKILGAKKVGKQVPYWGSTSIRHQCAKCRRHCDLAPGICASPFCGMSRKLSVQDHRPLCGLWLLWICGIWASSSSLKHLLITLLRVEFVVLVLYFAIYFYLCNFNHCFLLFTFCFFFLFVRVLWVCLFWFL